MSNLVGKVLGVVVQMNTSIHIDRRGGDGRADDRKTAQEWTASKNNER